MPYKKSLFFTGIVTLIFVVIALLYYFSFFGPHFMLVKASYTQLPNWQQGGQTQAFIAFKQSCTEIEKRDPHSAFSSLPQSGSTQNWQTICQAADKIIHPDPLTTRQFFENWFEPYYVFNNLNPRGLFTGYYLPVLQTSLHQNAQYSVPIYSLPRDLIKVNLGLFRPELAGKSIVGQLKNNILAPYPDRAAINNGAIKSNAKIIAWTNNAIDLMFAQIQGSAIAELPNHQQFLIGYDGDNGHRYTPIGKVLLNNNALPKQNISLQSIRAWLVQHPDKINDVLNQDASYVFFRKIGTGGATGKEGIPLTAQGSLAIDNNYIPLAVPIWLDTAIPQNNSNDKLVPFHHLLIAQDVGGAIKGIVRGDVYWGAGDNAAFIAGHMKSPGKYWMLLPKVRH